MNREIKQRVYTLKRDLLEYFEIIVKMLERDRFNESDMTVLTLTNKAINNHFDFIRDRFDDLSKKEANAEQTIDR